MGYNSIVGMRDKKRKVCKKNREKNMGDKIRTIDLFAGVGGIRLGFEKAGFKTVFANDFEPACKLTYDLNNVKTKLTIADINSLDIHKFPRFDFLLAGFPCQPFSVAGYRQGFNDEKGRGNLFFKIVEIIDYWQPKGFLLENVKNLKSHDNGNTFKVIKETLEDIGYYIDSRVLNSMDFGNVPQNRERVYIVGFRNYKDLEKFNFPSPKPLTISVKELLEKNVDKKYYYDDKPLFDRLKLEVINKNTVYQWRRRYVRENKSGVCPTLTANMGTGGHNVPIIKDDLGIRKLTPLECFRLQGFPQSFKLPKLLPDSALYKQAGNSVTVTVIEEFAKEINRVLSCKEKGLNRAEELKPSFLTN